MRISTSLICVASNLQQQDIYRAISSQRLSAISLWLLIKNYRLVALNSKSFLACFNMFFFQIFGLIWSKQFSTGELRTRDRQGNSCIANYIIGMGGFFLNANCNKSMITFVKLWVYLGRHILIQSRLNIYII